METGESKPKSNRGGARPGAGRKSKAHALCLPDLLNSAWPRARRLRTLKRMADAAEAGDVKAAALLLGYAYGKPKESRELSGPDGGAIPVEHDLSDDLKSLAADELVARYQEKVRSSLGGRGG